MSNDQGPDDHGSEHHESEHGVPNRRDEERIDSIAKAAGAALRQPAPADGIARLRAGRRRREIVRTTAAGSAVAALALALFVFVGRDSNDDRVVTTPPASTPVTTTVDSTETTPDTTTDTTTDTTPDTSPDTTPDTSAVTSAAPTTSTTQVPTTTAPAASTWAPATAEFPVFAFAACCGTNWQGDPSPAVPADPATPLAPGIYNVRTPAAEDAPAAADGHDTLTLEVRPYVSCNALEQFRCEGDPPYGEQDLGVSDVAARVIDLDLDDTIRVALSGFGCETTGAGFLIGDQQIGTGADLRRLLDELDAAYETAVAAPLRGGAVPEVLASDIAADSTGGFFDPGCSGYTNFAWKPPSGGPTILTFLNLFTLEGAPAPVPLASAADSFVRPTALALDDAGNVTLYLYAGFSS